MSEDAGASALEGQYLTFALEREVYGFDIRKVREINGMLDVTPIPRMPKFMKGVVNLRGKVFPVIDLRSKFEMPEVEYDRETCIIMVETSRGEGAEAVATMGVIVDRVREVINVSAESIEPPPAFGANVDTEFILGLAKIDKKVVILVDVDRILKGGELAMLDGTGEIGTVAGEKTVNV